MGRNELHLGQCRRNYDYVAIHACVQTQDDLVRANCIVVVSKTCRCSSVQCGSSTGAVVQLEYVKLKLYPLYVGLAIETRPLTTQPVVGPCSKIVPLELIVRVSAPSA